MRPSQCHQGWRGSEVNGRRIPARSSCEIVTHLIKLQTMEWVLKCYYGDALVVQAQLHDMHRL